MQIVILYNPRSGRGRGEAAAIAVEHALRAEGHTIRRRSVGPAAPTQPRAVSLNFDPSSKKPAPPPADSGPIGPADLIIAVGGDGTVHHILDQLAPRRSAIYQVPLGTENLFAREFGMSANPHEVARAVKAWRLRDIDLARCNGRAFAIMCSIGPDASVIRRLAASRTGAIRHRSYLKPVLGEMLRPSLPLLTITVDGKPAVTNQPGLAVIANCRQYALRIDPARRADAADGFLDVAFIPGRSTLALVTRLLGSRLRLRGRNTLHLRGRAINVEASGPAICSQLDGEVGPESSAGKLNLEFELEQRAVRVLLAGDEGAPQHPGRA